MSLQEQERLMFDLLFDKERRSEFCRESPFLLESYELSKEEKEDFSTIRKDALLIDAKMRRDLVLSHMCRAYPITFSICTSLADGRTLLKNLINVQTMRASSVQRTRIAGERLREQLMKFNFDVEAEKPLIIAILEAELGMAMTASALKTQILAGEHGSDMPGELNEGWAEEPIALAEFVSAAIIPRPYSELRRAFCKSSDTQLWHHLRKSPVSKSERSAILQNENPRLLLMRASLLHQSECEPVIEHKTMELSDGFAPLFQHLDGRNSVNKIVQELQNAGAQSQIIQGVKEGFRQMLENGMLVKTTS